MAWEVAGVLRARGAAWPWGARRPPPRQVRGLAGLPKLAIMPASPRAQT
jgi:hypothetical protein